jgi:universal stress protein A
VFIGAPAYDIRALAVELKADLIVVGTHGRHGLGLLLGSTANAIIHGVGCDVLAVRMRFDA